MWEHVVIIIILRRQGQVLQLVHSPTDLCTKRLDVSCGCGDNELPYAGQCGTDQVQRGHVAIAVCKE